MDRAARAHLDQLRGGLTVSCQADVDSPLHGPRSMAAMARAALLGGAVGIRADGAADVAAVRAVLGPDAPIIGIAKAKQPDGSLFITPTAGSARAVMAAGARLVALDGTRRSRSGGETFAAVVAAIHAAGAAAFVVVGTAITNPTAITAHFVAALEGERRGSGGARASG